MKVKIKTDNVSEGIFDFESYVQFTSQGKSYGLLTDKSNIEGDMLQVSIVEKKGNLFLVELPSDTFIAGKRFWFESEKVIRE